MVHGYVLISTALGKALEVADKVSKVKGIKRVCAVTGTYDVIVAFEVNDVSEIADVIVKEIHAIDGVCGTQTSICVRREAH